MQICLPKQNVQILIKCLAHAENPPRCPTPALAVPLAVYLAGSLIKLQIQYIKLFIYIHHDEVVAISV